MKPALFLALVCLLPGLLRAENTPRKAFPDDFVPTTCPTVGCDSFNESELRSAGGAFFGFNLDVIWVHQHLPELSPDFEKMCRKVTSCFATPPNSKMFCLDVLASEYRSICDRRFPKSESHESFEKCLETIETYILGLDQRMQANFEATRDCAAKNDPIRTDKVFDVWMVPSELKARRGEVPMTIYANDRQTHVPIAANITIEGQALFAPSNPVGMLATGYTFKWPVKYVRIEDGASHMQTVGPLITVVADGYPPVAFRLPVQAPKVIVAMQPGPEKVRAGRKNRIAVSVKDAVSGEAVDARVMAGQSVVGATNAPIELDLRKQRKRPEIWIAEPSNGASDYVIAPAEK